MKSVRLLPVVIFAALALLTFKSIGLLTSGSYVLTGTSEAEASGAPAETPAGGEAGNEITIEPEPTLVDTNPTMVDGAPIVGAEPAAGHGEPAKTGGHGEAAAGEGEETAEPAPVEQSIAEGHDTSIVPEPVHVAQAETPEVAAPVEEAHGEAVPEAGAEAAVVDACAPIPVAGAEAGGHGGGAAATDEEEGTGELLSQDCIPPDARPMAEDQYGNQTPLGGENGESLTEATILQRLTDRREALDSLSTELDARQALVDAAELRIEERSAVLAEMEARITAMVDEKKAMEEAQFLGVVGMYEAMKPVEAAKIMNALDMSVLERVAKTMNPRKMSAILAKMDTVVAQALTMQLAAVEPPPVPEVVGQDISALPQIVGQ